jgi:hypothetical protein
MRGKIRKIKEVTNILEAVFLADVPTPSNFIG